MESVLSPGTEVRANEKGRKLNDEVKVRRGRIDNIVGDQAVVTDYGDNDKRKLVMVDWLEDSK